MPSSPSQKASWTTWVNGLPTIPTAAYLAAEGTSPTTGPGREGKKDTVVSHEHMCAQSVCNEVRCRPHPASLPSPFHHCLTPAHTGKRLPVVLPNATSLHLADGSTYSPSAVGNRSLDVAIPHYRDARMQHSQSR